MRLGGRRLLAAFIAAGLALPAWTVAHASARVPHGLVTHDMFSRIPVRRKIVALTFDDGPDATVTPRVLDLLARYRVHATFFTTGAHMLANPVLVREEIAEGHEIGNHTFDHRTLTRLSRRAVESEIRRADDVFGALSLGHPVLFRPPRGLSSPRVLEIARELGHREVFWSIAIDRYARHESTRRAARDVLAHIRPGGIILAHDCCFPFDRRRALDVLAIVIPRLQLQGYQIVTVSELLHRGSLT
ncbi:MAG: polysaccharide deacetylase family protein [Actinomycetota bacterium]|nr:polysaccharide deacetylase family protein [Actinomycetota bacterium]